MGAEPVVNKRFSKRTSGVVGPHIHLSWRQIVRQYGVRSEANQLGTVCVHSMLVE